MEKGQNKEGDANSKGRVDWIIRIYSNWENWAKVGLN